MRVALVGSVVVIALGVAGRTPAAQVAPEAPPQMAEEDLAPDIRLLVARARDRVFPSLVNIEVVSVNFMSGKEVKGRSTGSGTIISAEGHVLTNAHVTDRGIKFWCTLADKQRVEATLVGQDLLTDLAVLKLDLTQLRLEGGELPVAAFGDSSALETGDYVLAMGSPLALSRTVTLGIVSNTERVFVSETGDVEEMGLGRGQRTGLFTNWIQHDALILPGNSGGPLVNLAGTIIGINTRGGAGLSFATPSNLAKAVVDSILERGSVTRSWIGATFKPIQGTGLERGVLIDSVDQESAAAGAGLKAGDVVIALDGEALTIRFPEEIPALHQRLAALPVGTGVAVEYERDTAPARTTVTTEELQRDRGDESALRAWGISVQQITPYMARQRRLTSTDGAVVTSVRPGGQAAQAEPSIQWGDVIRSVDGKTIEGLQDIVQKYEEIEALAKKPDWVLVEFERQGKSFVTLVDPEPPERADPPRELPKAWIGVATQPVLKDLAEKLGHPEHRGFRVVHVYGKTKASEAGLRVGDLIIGFEGQPLAPRGLQDAGMFSRAVRNAPIDATATVTVLRDGSPVEVPVTMERTRTTPEEAKRERSLEFELVVREVTFFDRDDNRWTDDVRGVLVESAEQAGWAGLGGVQSGDLIQRIGEAPVTDLASFKRAMEKVNKDQPERVVFVVLRGHRTHFRFVEPDWKPIIDEVPEGGEGS